MEKKEFENIFSTVLGTIITIDDNAIASKAISRLIELAECLDIGNFIQDFEEELKTKRLNIEELRESKKKWSLEKLMRFFLELCWKENQYKEGLQWYYITGLIFEMKNQKIERIKNKRDIKFCRNLVVDMNCLVGEIQDFSFFGSFGEWWNEPLNSRIIEPVNNQEVKTALEVLKSIGPNGQIVKRMFKGSLVKIDEIKELRDGEWFTILLNSGEDSYSGLISLIKEGNKCNGVIAAVVLDKISKSSWKNMPLSMIAIPLLNLFHEACAKERNWISLKFVISPKGDLGEWVWWIIMGHGNRMEPLLLERIKDKVKQQIPPYEFHVLLDLIVFHEDLSPKMYEFLYSIIDDIINRPEYFKGWFEFEFLETIFGKEWCKKKPPNWNQLCELMQSK